MTRGTFIFLTEDGRMLMSTEFNGDMGRGMECGDEAFERIKKVKTEDDFCGLIHDFNDEFFQYNFSGGHTYRESIFDWTDRAVQSGAWVKAKDDGTPAMLDFRKQYFDIFFSDWLYVTNQSNDLVKVCQKDAVNGPEEVYLPPGGVARFNFGEIEPDDPEWDALCQDLIRAKFMSTRKV